MRAYFTTVFDDIVQNTTEVYSDEAYNALLGSATSTSFQIIANVFDGGPRLLISLQHSADGRTWTDLPNSGTIDEALSWTDTNIIVGSYTSRFAACQVRFKLFLSDPSAARVKIIACGRSRAPRRPELPATSEVDSPDEVWPIEGGDEALLDEASLRQIRSLEAECGPDDAMVLYLKRELRRMAWARRLGQPVDEEPLDDEERGTALEPQRARPCPCSPPRGMETR